ESLGQATIDHLRAKSLGERLRRWRAELATRLGCTEANLPPGVSANPHLFCFLPTGPEFATRLDGQGRVAAPAPETQSDGLRMEGALRALGLQTPAGRGPHRGESLKHARPSASSLWAEAGT